MTVEKKKDSSIETLRGIAIVLVVMGHVIGYKADEGMKVAEDSFLRHLYYTFEYLRMPLFTVISGWVYALKPVSKSYFTIFTLKKCRRLLLPLIFVGGFYYIVQNLVPGTSNSYALSDIWKILVLPYTFYWYLQSLFIVFLIIAVIDIYKLSNKFSNWLIILCLSFILLIFRDTLFNESVPNIFGFKGAIYLFPFFLIGVGIKRFATQFNNKYLLWSLGIILIVCLVFQQLAWYKITDYIFSKNSGLGLVIGITGTITLMHSHFSNKWFAWLGNFAFSIFLFHSFGASGGRIIVNALGFHDTTFVFFVSLSLGLFLPIVAEKILDRFKITRFLLLGR
jgi:fucose 4-O-acetylase-like acetyltransferase